MHKPIPWQTNKQTPFNRALCLIVVNGQIVPDVFIFDAVKNHFFVYGLVGKEIAITTVRPNEVEAWILKSHIPLPTWASKRDRL